MTALLSLTSEPAIFPKPKDGNLRRRGFKGTSERLFFIALRMWDVFGFSFRDFFLHFPPNPYGIRFFQWNVGRYDRVIFMIFVGILWD